MYVCLQSAGWAHLCWDAMGQWQVYYMRNDIVCTCSRTSWNPKALQDISIKLHTVRTYIQFAAYYLYLAKLWAFGWSESICTLYKSSYSTSSIDPFYLCNSEPILDSVGRHTVCSILIISLEDFGPLTGPRAYAHYISPYIVHPPLTHCISATVSPFCTL